MALIKCPECGKEISDKAASCPNCGCPISMAESNRTEIMNDDTEKSSIRSSPVVKNSNTKVIFIALVACILFAIIAVIVGRGISKKNAEAKRIQQIQDVKTAMDNVDSSLAELIIALDPPEPFLYGDSVSDSHKSEIKSILDTITENQKIVEDAYKNEDREFIKELDDYISANKTYRSWDDYNDEIKKLYGNSISNEQAADNLVKEMASTEEDYRNYKNHYLILCDWNGDFEDYDIDKNFDPEMDFHKVTSGEHAGEYYYDPDPPWVINIGTEKPKHVVFLFKLLGTNGRVIAEQEWVLDDQKSNDYLDVKTYGIGKDDHICFNSIQPFYSDVNDTPTGMEMEVVSVGE